MERFLNLGGGRDKDVRGVGRGGDLEGFDGCCSLGDTQKNKKHLNRRGALEM